MNPTIEPYLIRYNQNLLEALEKLNCLSDQLTLMVINEQQQLVGTLTDGDIRRGLLNGKSIYQKVEDFMFKRFRYVRKNQIDIKEIKHYRELSIKLLPLLNDNNQIVELIDLTKIKNYLPVDAVIMAGGKGERLRPLTDNTPKPMLPLGNKPILEHNIDWLKKYGIKNFFISVNYLAEKITNYFGNGSEKNINIEYIKESFPMGTAGSISLIPSFHNDTLLIMNSDLFTNIDLEEMYLIYEKEKANMVIATIPYNVNVPFAILELDNSRVTSVIEKPIYTYYANAGIYLIKKEMIKYIPSSGKFDMTDLIKIVLQQKGKVIKFPVLGYWIDIGRHEDYQKAQEYVKYLER